MVIIYKAAVSVETFSVFLYEGVLVGGIKRVVEGAQELNRPSPGSTLPLLAVSS